MYMNKKTAIKVIIDIIMFFMILLLYKKQAISLAYHEISGLILMAIFIVHIGLNFKWVKNVATKFFSQNTDLRSKIIYIVDFLLFLGFIIVIISGIFISKIVFSLGMENFLSLSWKMIHFKAASICLVLFGIHLGLHAGFISGIGKKFIKLPRRLSKIVFIVLSCVFIAYGAYSVKTTSFSRYITSSITSSQDGGEHMQLQNGSQASQGYQGQNGQQSGAQSHNSGGISAGNIFSTIASYFTIAYLFAFIAAVADKLIRKAKSKKVTV